MRKIESRYRLGNKLLKIYSANGYLRGVLYEFKWDTSVSPNKVNLVKVSAANFYEKDGDATEYRVKQYFGMCAGKFVTNDNFVNVHHRVIWTNNDYAEWEACMKADYPTEESLKAEGLEISYEQYYKDCEVYLDDERANLDEEVDGVIVAFANLGLWNGRVNGARIEGTNVKDILHSNCDYLDWYCDRYNVHCDATHHDGTNHYIYRVAKDREQAERLVNKIAYEGMTEEEFRKATHSLRPYVAKVYGW
jgi:hypothetical protein